MSVAKPVRRSRVGTDSPYGRPRATVGNEEREQDRVQSDQKGNSTADPSNTPFVSVSVRIRPDDPSNQIALWVKPPEPGEFDSRRIVCHRGHMLEEYEFSRVLGPQCDNKTVFTELNGVELVGSVFKGVNETIFAYGQTGSGKTHTIFGTDGELGLLQFMIQAIFQKAVEVESCTIHLCCFEIFGDQLTDLLDVRCLDDTDDIIDDDIVYDELFLKTQKCRYQIIRLSKMTTALELLEHASYLRTCGTSSLNDRSSRSHAVCQFFIQNSSMGTLGAMSLVDLAGSEKEQENPSEQGRKSARVLNTSLSSLNRLLRKLQTNSLCESERRQSVLNKVLWDYVRGGCGISLIFCLSPLLKHRAVSLSTVAMATDSKMMNNRRKQQYLQVNGNYVLQEPAMHWDLDGSPRRASTGYPRDGAASTLGAYGSHPRSSTPRSDKRPGSAPRSPTTPEQFPVREMVRKYEERIRDASQERCGDSSHPPEPSGGPLGRAGGSAGTLHESPLPMFVKTHSDGRLSAAGYNVSPSVAPMLSPSEQMALGDQPISAEDLKRICEQSPMTIREIVVQNSRLQQKCNKIRRRSRDRINAGHVAHKRLVEENDQLREECHALRQLFLKQQKQQLDFWTGSFMEDLSGHAKKRSSAGGSSTTGATSIGTPGYESPEPHGELLQNSHPVTPPSATIARSGSSGDPLTSCDAESWVSLKVLPKKSSRDAESWVPADDFWKSEVQKLRQDLLQKRRSVPGGRREDVGEPGGQQDCPLVAGIDLSLDVSTKITAEARRTASGVEAGDVDGTYGLSRETSSGSGELSTSSSSESTPQQSG